MSPLRTIQLLLGPYGEPRHGELEAHQEAIVPTENTIVPDGTMEQNRVYKGPVYEMANQSSLYGANVFTGPSCLVDPASGDIYMFSIMQDQRGGGCKAASDSRALPLLAQGDVTVTQLYVAKTGSIFDYTNIYLKGDTERRGFFVSGKEDAAGNTVCISKAADAA